jgi:hypothetical protein
MIWRQRAISWEISDEALARPSPSRVYTEATGIAGVANNGRCSIDPERAAVTEVGADCSTHKLHTSTKLITRGGHGPNVAPRM